MEKKKLLLVAISVGIFLVIAVVAGIVIIQHNDASTGIAAAPAPTYQSPAEGFGSYQLDAVDLVRNPDEVPGLKPSPDGIADHGSEFYVSGQGLGNETVINVPRPSAVAIPDTVTTAPAKPASATQKPQTSAQAKPQAKPAAQTKVYNDYWVQTGAFSTIVKAEGVKETLASRGITSIIENRDINGKTLFRVRVGPYTSQNEATYWLSLVKSINGFEDSQIRQSQSRR